MLMGVDDITGKERDNYESNDNHNNKKKTTVCMVDGNSD